MNAKERFYKQFQEEVTVLTDRISQLGSVAISGGERQYATEAILASISNLSTQVADASDFVPLYDQRTYSEVIKALKDQLNDEITRLAPKKRFQFKPRKASPASSGGGNAAKPADTRHLKKVAFAVPETPSESESAVAEPEPDEPDSVGALPSFTKNYNEEVAQTTGPGIRKPSFSAAREINLSDHDSIHIILPSSAARATSSGSLWNLKSCVVDMSIPTSAGVGGAFSGLALKDISRSLVIVGHVDGPMHVTGITDSVIVVAARQVRMHECRNVVVYLQCTSRPIIEDCTEMRFAPLPQRYMGPNDKADKNQWDQVDDFKWLKADHSPNWSLLPEENRLPTDVWENVVHNPNLDTVDILKKAGIARR